MCLAVYIGTDEELPLSAWVEDQTLVCFSALNEKDFPVRKHFSSKNVYYVGSDEGCGCGFRLE